MSVITLLNIENENLSITCRNFEMTEAIRTSIEHHTQKLKKFLSKGAKIDWVCWMDSKEHFCEVTVKNNASSFFICSHSNNFYKTLDVLTHRLKKQLSKKKEILKERIHHKNRYSLKLLELGTLPVPLFPS